MDFVLARKAVGARAVFAYDLGVHRMLQSEEENDMATIGRPEASAIETRRAGSLDAVTNTAQAVLFLAAAAQLALGAVIWTGEADQLIPVHILIGIVLVLSLWTIAAIAARSGVGAGLIAAAVAWSVVAPILGTTQEGLLEGDWHWTVQVVHVLIGIGVAVWGRALVVLMRKRTNRS